MKVRTLIPNIRFRGFSDPWEQRKLYQIATINPKSVVSPHFLYVDLESVSQNRVTQYRAVTKDNAPSRAQRLAKKGDIFFQNVRPYQKNNLLFLTNKNNVVFSTGYTQIRAKQDIRYLFYTLQTTPFVNRILALSTGTSYPAISSSKLANASLLVPIIDEQSKVGLTIFKIDSLIAANEDKVQQLKTLKKLMMQKIFSQEWRFKGFTDPWEQRKLESVVIVYDKGRVPVTSTERISGDTPYYGANGIQDYVDGYTHDGEFTLIAEDGANDTRNYPIKFVSGKIWVNNHAHVLAGKQNILNTRFLSFSLQQINIEPFLSGSGRAKLNASEMKKLLIAVPNIYEQIKVENFLGEMAHLIAANEDKLNQLKRLKKYLMQNLFV
ncbi:restriction endonuclease subunit S [Lactiplantibacillus plantarum]|uniref:restriction endonuclease subunit S n=1 Tax=Lactiplantibacillus plantarum TaxID=1590 RepID=UPI0020872826|nr:restriction endonuclease subunit S [Lactiplantibacillus plantarum]MCG0690064.1 restriction endonuclease subunit S [Lactiplantibacillus plantarum]MCG0941330.1 restriction endonuclease subunit S [Lactiplantibacillus plantarum]GIP77501.1 restriction endonuclease subunit S [Lactiplantibacillus plantarum]